MHICVISPSYPTTKTIDFIFVDQLCRAFADRGEKVTIIAPQSLTKCIFRSIPLSRKHSFIRTETGNKIEIYRPYTITFGNSWIGNLFKDSFNNAVNRVANRLKKKPDVCYGHFWQSINAISLFAKENNIPLFGASGEENVELYAKYTDEEKHLLSQCIKGIINVSTKNRNECLNLNLITEEKSIVIPNAINLSLFKQQDKKKCRNKLGIKDDDFVVAFVGQFVVRKGTLRLNEALKKINDRSIKAIFIGTGNESPDYEGIIYKGKVNHDELPLYLSASDIFVLPTDNEGCCNAIIEAMACGLPIISTDKPFNHDILNKDNSVLIDCYNINQIAESIELLRRDNDKRKKMSQCALKSAENLSIDKRAERIINFIVSKK